MILVETWLSGIGLGYAVGNFKAAGVVAPAALAGLTLGDFDSLGVTDTDDRKKLFYLVQRVRLAVEKGSSRRASLTAAAAPPAPEEPETAEDASQPADTGEDEGGEAGEQQLHAVEDEASTAAVEATPAIRAPPPVAASPAPPTAWLAEEPSAEESVGSRLLLRRRSSGSSHHLDTSSVGSNDAAPVRQAPTRRRPRASQLPLASSAHSSTSNSSRLASVNARVNRSLAVVSAEGHSSVEHSSSPVKHQSLAARRLAAREQQRAPTSSPLTPRSRAAASPSARTDTPPTAHRRSTDPHAALPSPQQPASSSTVTSSAAAGTAAAKRTTTRPELRRASTGERRGHVRGSTWTPDTGGVEGEGEGGTGGSYGSKPEPLRESTLNRVPRATAVKPKRGLEKPPPPLSPPPPSPPTPPQGSYADSDQQTPPPAPPLKWHARRRSSDAKLGGALSLRSRSESPTPVCGRSGRGEAARRSSGDGVGGGGGGWAQAKQLMAAHRAAVTEMMGMLQQELALVHVTDSSRGNVESCWSYLSVMESMLARNTTLIGGVQDKLAEVQQARMGTV